MCRLSPIMVTRFARKSSTMVWRCPGETGHARQVKGNRDGASFQQKCLVSGLLRALVIGLMGVVSVSPLFAQSEIDAYDRAVSSQSKDAALAFLREYRSSHLIVDMIESLRPDLAREVCTSLQGGGPGAARRACSSLPPADAAPSKQVPVGNVATQNNEASPPALPQTMTDEMMMSSGIGEVPISPTSGATSDVSLGFVEPSAGPPPSAGVAEVIPPKAAVIPGYRVQLLSTRSATQTQEGWSQLQAAYPDLLGPLEFKLVEVNLGADSGIWYRGFAGPMADWDEANMLCIAIRSRVPHNDCIIAH
jgi:hypothetical protein